MPRFARTLVLMVLLSNLLVRPLFARGNDWNLPEKDTARLEAIPAGTMSPDELRAYVNSLQDKLLQTLNPALIKQVDAKITALGAADPNDLNTTGVLAWYAGEPEAGLLMTLRAAVAKPGHLPSLNSLAAFLLMGGYPEKAIPILLSLLKEHPEDSTLLNNLGQAYLRLGDAENASKFLLACVAKRPYHPEANNSLGALYEAQGDAAKAVEHFEASLKGGFSQFAEKRLRKNKKGYNAVPLLLSHLPKGPEYFNPYKYQMPPQCETVDTWEKARGPIMEAKELFMTTKAKFENQARAAAKTMQDDIEKAQKSGNFMAMSQAALKMAGGGGLGVGQEIFGQEMAQMSTLIVEIDQFRRTQLEPAMKKLHEEYKAKVKEINQRYEELLKTIPNGEGTDNRLYDKTLQDRCREKETAANEYLPKRAALVTDFLDRFLPRLRSQTNDIMTWSLVANRSPGKENYFYMYAGSYLSQLVSFLNLYANLDPGYDTVEVCRKFDDPGAVAKKEGEDLDSGCPFKFSLSAKLFSISFNCESFSIAGGEGLLFEYEKKFDKNGFGGESTLAIGIGLSTNDIRGKEDIEISGMKESEGVLKLEAAAAEKIYIKFDKDNKFSDIGMKLDLGAAAKVGNLGMEGSAGMTIGVNAGLDLDPGSLAKLPGLF